MRRFVSFLLGLLMAAGLVIAVWPLGQSFYGEWSQRSLAAEWQKDGRGIESTLKSRAKTQRKSVKPSAQLAGVSAPVTHDADSPAPAMGPNLPRKTAPWPLTKMSIPAIELETFVVQGMDSAALKRGPGHDANSGVPGEGNCVIAGHRNVYGSFFYRLDELQPGASITMENRDGKFSYTVSTLITTSDTDLTVLQPPPPNAPPLLTLITCTMPHSNSRIVLQATLNAE